MAEVYRRFKETETQVPILTNEQIDELAQNYAVGYCSNILEKPRPLDIDDFMEFYLGLEVEVHFLSHNGMYLGVTVFEDTDFFPIYNLFKNQAEFISIKGGTVIIDELQDRGYEPRTRFTKAHECGHFIMHKDFFQGSSICLYSKCESAIIADDLKVIERQADRFAAGLLVPRDAVIDMSKRMWRYGYEDDEIIDCIQETFNVSRQAAEYRLKDLDLIG